MTVRGHKEGNWTVRGHKGGYMTEVTKGVCVKEHEGGYVTVKGYIGVGVVVMWQSEGIKNAM